QDMRRPRQCPLGPYTTLFRSQAAQRTLQQHVLEVRLVADGIAAAEHVELRLVVELVERRRREDLAQGRHEEVRVLVRGHHADALDRKSTRLNSSHVKISYAVF